MNERGMELPRYNQRPVILRFSPTDVLSGIRFKEHPELPPLVEAPAISRVWYAEVWERGGWTITDVDDAKPDCNCGDGSHHHCEQDKCGGVWCPERGCCDGPGMHQSPYAPDESKEARE